MLSLGKRCTMSSSFLFRSSCLVTGTVFGHGSWSLGSSCCLCSTTSWPLRLFSGSKFMSLLAVSVLLLMGHKIVLPMSGLCYKLMRLAVLLSLLWCPTTLRVLGLAGWLNLRTVCAPRQVLPHCMNGIPHNI